MDLPSNKDAEKMAMAAGAMGCVITLIYSNGRSVSINWFEPRKTVGRTPETIPRAKTDIGNDYRVGKVRW